MPFPRSPLNAPGPFYSTGECMACGAPEDEAPDLLADLRDDQLETYFIRQPSSPAEIERACRAAQVCCIDAIRYAGSDPDILRRLGNSEQYCDFPTSRGSARVICTADAEAPVASRPRRWWQFWEK